VGKEKSAAPTSAVFKDSDDLKKVKVAAAILGISASDFIVMAATERADAEFEARGMSQESILKAAA